MKGRILNIVLVLVMATLPMATNAGWGEVQQVTKHRLPAPSQVAQTPAPDEDFKSSPVMFIENVGQWDDGARFQGWGEPAGTMWLAEDAIWITVLEVGETSGQVDKALDPVSRWKSKEQEDLAPRRGVNIKLSFVGANPAPRIETFDRLDTTVSYFLGNNPDRWRPEVPVWGGVRYVGLYPGVDLELTSQAGQMVPRLAAWPGAKLDAVQLHVEGADAVAVHGDVLRLGTVAGEFTLPLLRADGLRVTGSNVEPNGAQSFNIAAPFTPANANWQSEIENRRSPADNPADLLYGTFVGGSNEDHSYAIAADAAGSAYVTGYTESTDFPTTPGAFDTSLNGNRDAFVAKLNPAGSGLTYATYLGGGSSDYGQVIIVDGAGGVYVTGYTYSSDFPATPDAFDRTYNGSGDAFVAKLNPAGNTLAYSTFLGGSDLDHRPAIAVDGAGSAYLTGTTRSINFPATPGAFDTSHNGGYDVFVAKLNPAGTALAYATFLGGYGDNVGSAIAVDGAGSAYVTGGTDLRYFPTTPGAFDTSYNGGGSDAFVAKLNPAGSALTYATFLGGNDLEDGLAIAVDGAGSAYVMGDTESTNFPTTPGAFDTSYDGTDDAFVAKLNPAGSTLAYATFLGGSSYDGGRSIAVDRAHSAYVVGDTFSTNFPTTPGAFDTSYNGSNDAFIARLNPAGSALVYATFLGGGNEDSGRAIAVDRAGSAYVTGDTLSANFPATPGAFDTSYNGDCDAFVVKLAQVPNVYLYLPVVLVE